VKLYYFFATFFATFFTAFLTTFFVAFLATFFTAFFTAFFATFFAAFFATAIEMYDECLINKFRPHDLPKFFKERVDEKCLLTSIITRKKFTYKFILNYFVDKFFCKKNFKIIFKIKKYIQ